MSGSNERVTHCNDTEKYALFRDSIARDNIITLELTVGSGFEYEAKSEALEKFDGHLRSDILMNQGRIFFNIEVQSYHIVRRMRSIDNVYMVCAANVSVPFIHDEDRSAEKLHELEKFKRFVGQSSFEKYIKVFAELTNFVGNVFPSELEHARAKIVKQRVRRLLDSYETIPDVDDYKHDVLRYRVTCKRQGTHLFTSNEAAAAFGGAINDLYQWAVDLSNYDLEIVLYVKDDQITTVFRLSRTSLHRRMLTVLGLTTLRPTIAYNMLRMAKIQAGDVVVDPLCGSGSIVLESLQAYPNATTMCGDIDPEAVKLTNLNIRNAAPGLPVMTECRQWDALHLPVDNHSVDVIVTDLPFGKRCGKRSNNSLLYPAVFNEFCRVLKLDKGRMVVITYDKKNLERALKGVRDRMNYSRSISANVGGLKTAVVVYKRNGVNADTNLNDLICDR